MVWWLMLCSDSSFKGSSTQMCVHACAGIARAPHLQEAGSWGSQPQAITQPPRPMTTPSSEYTPSWSLRVRKGAARCC